MNLNITTACKNMTLSAVPSFALSYLIYRNTNQALLTAAMAAGAQLVNQIAMPHFQTIMQKWPISLAFWHGLVSQLAYNLTRSFTKTPDPSLSAYQTRVMSVTHLIQAARFASCYLYTSYTWNNEKPFTLNSVWDLAGRMTWLA
jgi:hypothetical protein